MKSILIACLALLVSSACYAEAGSPSPFLDEVLESQKVQDFFASRCHALAQGNNIQSSDTQHGEYIANCMQDMAEIWPIGYDESE